MNLHREFELAVPVSAIDHVLGAAHAPVTVVEYGDFECPNCTPTFFITGVIQDVSFGLDSLARSVEEMLRR